jgi:phosphoribosyl-ATP pyrophosphohydrolase
MASYIFIASRSNLENQSCKENLQSKRKLKIDYNSKSYLKNTINFNASLFLGLISKFWHHTLLLHQEANLENQSCNENLQSKRKLKIDSNSKSYLENPINFNASLFLGLISKFWHHTLLLHQEANLENQSCNENLQSKRKLKINSNSKSYLENPINFNASLFLRPISKF